MFAAPDGRLWGASLRRGPGESAIVFSCITDSRLSVRAAAVDPAFRFGDASDDELRRWFADAPTVRNLG